MDNQASLVRLISLGCAKNLVDSEILVGGLKQSFFKITEESEKADIVIINTCGFLDQAREESINVILEAVTLKKSGNLKQLIVVGCLSERYPTELKKEIPEVDRFFGTNDHRQIISFLTGKAFAKDDPLFFRSLLTPKHYAYLKIAEGCDNGCSFCSIPLMRGLQKSRSISSIYFEAERLVDGGVKELLIIAQDTTSYGWDLPQKVYLSDLIRELDKLNKSLEWVRIHYAHPAHLSSHIIEAIAASEKVCHYLDIPIQHASDNILSSMKRGLGSDGIRKKIEELRHLIPDIHLRTTLIVGYPNESDQDFETLYNFVDEIRFDRLGIFTYSEEEGTAAEQLADNIPESVKNERKALLLDLQNEISADKNKKLEGQNLRVLVDLVNNEVGTGRTEFDSPEVDNIVKLSGAKKVGVFETVKITGSSAYELSGTVVD